MGAENIIADIETTSEADSKEGFREWLVVRDMGSFISVGRDHSGGRYDRRPDPEAGICVEHGAQLEALIIALQAAQRQSKEQP